MSKTWHLEIYLHKRKLPHVYRGVKSHGWQYTGGILRVFHADKMFFPKDMKRITIREEDEEAD